MQQANYPLIELESTTVSFILRGLAARPSLQTHVTTLMLQQQSTIRAARAAVQVLQNSVKITSPPPVPARPKRTPYNPQPTIYWCDYHQAYVNHPTHLCRDRQRELARQQYAAPPTYAVHGAMYASTQPHPYQYPTQPPGFAQSQRGRASAQPRRGTQGRGAARARAARLRQHHGFTAEPAPQYADAPDDDEDYEDAINWGVVQQDN